MTIREPRPLNEYEQWELLKNHEKEIEEILLVQQKLISIQKSLNTDFEFNRSSSWDAKSIYKDLGKFEEAIEVCNNGLLEVQGRFMSLKYALKFYLDRRTARGVDIDIAVKID